MTALPMTFEPQVEERITRHPAIRNQFSDLQHYFKSHGFPAATAALHRAITAVSQAISAQAATIDYAASFGLIGVILLVAKLPMAMLRKHPRRAHGD
jgi:hypothetical protein